VPGHDPPAPKGSDFLGQISSCLIEKSTAGEQFIRRILWGRFVGFVVWDFFFFGRGGMIGLVHSIYILFFSKLPETSPDDHPQPGAAALFTSHSPPGPVPATSRPHPAPASCQPTSNTLAPMAKCSLFSSEVTHVPQRTWTRRRQQLQAQGRNDALPRRRTGRLGRGDGAAGPCCPLGRVFWVCWWLLGLQKHAETGLGGV